MERKAIVRFMRNEKEYSLWSFLSYVWLLREKENQ